MGEAKPEIFGVPDVSWLPNPPWIAKRWRGRFGFQLQAVPPEVWEGACRFHLPELLQLGCLAGFMDTVHTASRADGQTLLQFGWQIEAGRWIGGCRNHASPEPAL